jgi:pimeloyl-ACP methyl ester carboxylesterase
VLPLFARDRHVVALDLPGSGGTAMAGRDAFTINGLGRHVGSVVDALGVPACHLVGHDHGGLVALWLAMEVPDLVRSLTVVASPSAAPTGDGLHNFTLAHPPAPLWSRASQAWALERISYSRHHIDDALLDRSVACAAGTPHRDAVAVAADGGYQRVFGPSAAKTRGRVFATCRERGIAAPVQVVWGSHDPLTTPKQGFALYQAIAARQRAAQYHLINRAGALPFHEEPETFHQIVAAFQDGVQGERYAAVH